MPERITYPIFMPIAGQVLDAPQEFLQNQMSPYCRNMELENGMMAGRYGLSKMSATALSGRVLAKAILKTFAGTRYEVFCTPKDIYAYDFGNARFDILTPLYTTGTIEVKTGELNKVYGSGTPAWNTNLKAGDFIKIGSGSVHTGSTWYEIATVNSATLLTLTSNAPITAAGTAYVARKTFTGGNTDYWDWVQFQDANLGEILIVTNGVDKPHYWTGSGSMTIFSAVPTSLTAAKYVSVYAGRLILMWTVEGGQNQPQRIQATQPYDITDWDADAFPIDLADDFTEIKGGTKFGDYLVVFKERNAYIGRYVGGDYILSFQASYECKGVRSAWSVIAKNDYLYYYGDDKKFHRWNLLKDDILSEDNFMETEAFDPNTDEFVQGFDVSRSNQIRWFCPYGDTDYHNYVYVFDYSAGISHVWEYENEYACCCIGSYRRVSDVYADDAVYGAQYADETGGYADDSDFLDNGDVIIYGGYDGYIRIADSGVVDDGSDYTRLFRFKRLNFDMPDMVKRLWRQQWWLEAQTAGAATIKMMKDDKTAYESTTKSISLIPSNNEAILKTNITWDMFSQEFQPEISATVHFALLGIMNIVFPKRRRHVN